MTRIVILGGPKTGKTTLADRMLADATRGPGGHGGGPTVFHTDDLISMGWSEASQYIADRWLNDQGDWIIEGVAAVRALRKWRDQHPGERPPVDRVIRLTTPHVELSKGQAAMAKGEETVWSGTALDSGVNGWLEAHGVNIEHGSAREGSPPRAPGQLLTDA